MEDIELIHADLIEDCEVCQGVGTTGLGDCQYCSGTGKVATPKGWDNLDLVRKYHPMIDLNRPGYNFERRQGPAIRV